MSDQKGKVAIVTGATRGLGKSAAIALADRGFHVIVTGRTLEEGQGRTDNLAEQIVLPGSISGTIREIEARGGTATGIALDIMDRASIDRVIDQTMEAHGRIDVLYSNALYAGPGNAYTFLEADMGEALRCFEGTVMNQLYLAQKVVRPMIAQGGGRVIFMSSAASFRIPLAKPPACGYGVLYSASKSAYNKLHDFLHLEHASDGIQSFLIQPEFTFTDTMEAKYGDNKPFPTTFKPHKPEDVSSVIVWMATSGDAIKYAGAPIISAPFFFAENGITPEV
jgi:3-oxoacyl-[acyl-carrier protein] reductase